MKRVIEHKNHETSLLLKIVTPTLSSYHPNLLRERDNVQKDLGLAI
jgi:hypothetical protein